MYVLLPNINIKYKNTNIKPEPVITAVSAFLTHLPAILWGISTSGAIPPNIAGITPTIGKYIQFPISKPSSFKEIDIATGMPADKPPTIICVFPFIILAPKI